MSRLRIQVPGATYHVMARGADRRRIFVDDEDYALYVRLLATVALRQGWRLLAFCLMPNHVHMLIETPQPNLANGMQWLHGRYALAFNLRHVRVGHLFETRYKSPIVADDMAFVRTVRYIVLNPVAAALCGRAVDWEWGSHAIVADGDVPHWLSHARLEERLTAIATPRFYPRLIAAGERANRRRESEDATLSAQLTLIV